MMHMTRWVCNLLLPSLLWACTSTERSAPPVSHEFGSTTAAIQFDKTVHFPAPDGAPVPAAPDEYLVEQTTDAQLRLVPHTGGSPLIVAADQCTHDLEVSAPFPLVLALTDDERNVMLLMPDSTALNASGSLSGVRAREIVRSRRHYQLAYQFDQATGQVQFGDGVAGQRPPRSQSQVASNYRVGAGSIGNIGATSTAGAEHSMIELQSALSNRTTALALATNIAAAQNEHFHLEYNTDRPGSDYGQRAIISPETCRAICSADGSCQAFTFVKPPAAASAGQCYLKQAVPTQNGYPCCISA